VVSRVAELEFVAGCGQAEGQERIRQALVPAPRLYFFLNPKRNDWPISGRITGDGFQIRTRSGWSNGSNVVWALGRFDSSGGETRVRVRFMLEPIGLVGLVMMLAVVVLLFLVHSWLAWALLAFVVVVVGIAIAVARSERNALTRFLLAQLR
jgi:hypothetical protein